MPVSPRTDPAAAAGAPRCPICRKAVGPAATAFPFCCRRCQVVDLGRWLGGEYRIEVPIEETDRDLPPATDLPEREDAS